MVRTILLLPVEWSGIMENALESRDGFDEELCKIIFNNGEKQIINTEIIFPESLTTSNRYRIHTYSQIGMLTSTSSGEGNNRSITCFLTKKYTKHLFDTYFVEPEDTDVKNIKNIKYKIFTDIMQVLKNNFGEEFEQYLNNI